MTSHRPSATRQPVQGAEFTALSNLLTNFRPCCELFTRFFLCCSYFCRVRLLNDVQRIGKFILDLLLKHDEDGQHVSY